MLTDTIILVEIIGNNDMNILICGDMNARCGNILDYLEDEDKYIQINNMSMNESENVFNNYSNALHQFQCIYSE